MADSFPEPSTLVVDLLESMTSSGWSMEVRDVWTYLYPIPETRRIQGWKLHISATVLSAPEVLGACVPLLRQARTPFKFASTAQDLNKLNDFRTPRGYSGKFITVYPPDVASLCELADLLHAATRDMAGPAILSDARYAPGSLVHCRFGAFDGFRVLTNDGKYRNCILDPDTRPIEDQRLGVFQHPQWTECPFDAGKAAQVDGGASRQVKSVLLRGRYEISTAIRHANKGGVYLANDRETGLGVVIKEARPHVGTDAQGRDACDFLRHETSVLRRLAGLNVVPSVVEEFEQGGHCFLVEEFVPGLTLRQTVDVARETGADPRTPQEIADLAVQLAQMLHAIHDRGVVVRDLSPSNLMVLPDGTMRIFDLEHAAVRLGPDATWSVLGLGHGTPGVSAPEQFESADPDPSADLYSLGVILQHQITRRNPVFIPDRPKVRTIEARSAEVSVRIPAMRAMPTPIRQIVTGLTRVRPEERLSLDEVIEWALKTQIGSDSEIHGSDTATDGDEHRWDTLIQGILRHLAGTAESASHSRPWPETLFGTDVEPCVVQHGLAGHLAVFARLIECGVDGPLDQLVELTLPRIIQHLDHGRHGLPGMNFGMAGTAWSLFDIGKVLDRADILDRAVRLAASLPTRWPSPDITHGLAGLGSCLLYLAAETGDTDLQRRAVTCAENILAAADPGDEEFLWTVPPSFDSELAGYRSYGFAHGVAGIGAFLLAAAHATGREDFAAAATRCADTLLAAEITRNGAGFWPDTPGSHSLNVWWCNGSAGVGTFLCRMYARTGEARYRDSAAAAARAVQLTRAQMGTSYCHGLAGNGDFLIDLGQATGDDTYRRDAATIADLLWADRVYRDGCAVLPDETAMEITAGFGSGLAGHLAFLTRLRFGGPRLFHPDPSVPAATPGP